MWVDSEEVINDITCQDVYVAKDLRAMLTFGTRIMGIRSTLACASSSVVVEGVSCEGASDCEVNVSDRSKSIPKDKLVMHTSSLLIAWWIGPTCKELVSFVPAWCIVQLWFLGIQWECFTCGPSKSGLAAGLKLDWLWEYFENTVDEWRQQHNLHLKHGLYPGSEPGGSVCLLKQVWLRNNYHVGHLPDSSWQLDGNLIDSENILRTKCVKEGSSTTYIWNMGCIHGRRFVFQCWYDWATKTKCRNLRHTLRSFSFSFSSLFFHQVTEPFFGSPFEVLLFMDLSPPFRPAWVWGFRWGWFLFCFFRERW